MVDRVSPIAATSPSSVTSAEDSLSITSEPDNALVARRQSEITAAMERKKERDILGHEGHHSAEGHEPSGDGARPADPDKATDAERLSGESERIGTGNWEDDVPPGEHVAYL